ncbi:LysR family transcriptional regulator [Pseudonocardia zijingensis]|jgi:DNA-binding transcriptional LysR family regulator|uniref:LysR family transcriptional regulator n=1 Tax=Pseudonocardia zijingensis TaxID=153376 RepID=A0ABN1Q0H5_9PSEU
MELRQLRYLVAVYAEGSISRAAAHLLLSQPALTRQIRALEREMGVVLFERTSTGVRPTASGTALHTHAVQILRLADQSREVARSAAPVRERVDVGLPPGVPQHWLRSVLAQIRASVPAAGVTFLDAASSDQLRMLAEGTLDVGIVHQNPPDTLRHVPVLAEPFGVAIRPGHRLAGTEPCRLADLDDVVVLAHGRDQVPAEHDRMVLAAHESGVRPQWRFVRFSENALLCAEAVDADAVLLSHTTAARLLPDWPWRRLVEPQVDLRTWVAHPVLTRSVVRAVAGAIVATAPG